MIFLRIMVKYKKSQANFIKEFNEDLVSGADNNLFFL